MLLPAGSVLCLLGQFGEVGAALQFQDDALGRRLVRDQDVAGVCLGLAGLAGVVAVVTGLDGLLGQARRDLARQQGVLHGGVRGAGDLAADGGVTLQPVPPGGQDDGAAVHELVQQHGIQDGGRHAAQLIRQALRGLLQLGGVYLLRADAGDDGVGRGRGQGAGGDGLRGGGRGAIGRGRGGVCGSSRGGGRCARDWGSRRHRRGGRRGRQGRDNRCRGCVGGRGRCCRCRGRTRGGGGCRSRGGRCCWRGGCSGRLGPGRCSARRRDGPGRGRALPRRDRRLPGNLGE